MLAKRDVKKGKPCSAVAAYKDWELASDNYPSNGQLGADVDAYGWTKQNDYCDYNWQSGTKANTGSSYHSEHVMEWQIVTDFFVKMQSKGGSNYVHPDPSKNGQKVDFCTYWIESWDIGQDQGFSINGSSALVPWRHIAAAYPSNSNYKEEMIKLQDNINTPAKANVSSPPGPPRTNSLTCHPPALHRHRSHGVD